MFVQPADLSPSASFPYGDFRLNLIYMLHPSLRSESTITPSISGYSKRILSNHTRHMYGGSLFRAEDLPKKLCKHIQSRGKSLLPDNVLIEIQQCKDPGSLIDVIKRNDDLFDTFHHDANGRAPRGIIKSITESRFPQPRRVTFSAYLSQPSYFPLLGAPVQRFFLYGHGGRPSTDGRCRVVMPALMNVFVHS